jgi:hypothetical protein
MVAVPELVSGLDAELVRLGYKASTMVWYRGCWRRLERFFASRGVQEFSLDLAMAWVDEACGGFFDKEQAGTLKPADVYLFRVAQMLDVWVPRTSATWADVLRNATVLGTAAGLFRGHGQLAARDIPVQRGQRLLLWRHLGLPFRSRDSDAVSPCCAVSGSHAQAARFAIQWLRRESEDSAFPPRYCAQHAWPVLLQAHICVSAAVP